MPCPCQAREHDLVSAAARLLDSPRCIAARHWDTRKLECVRLYCAAGTGGVTALQFDTEKLLLGTSRTLLAMPTAPAAAVGVAPGGAPSAGAGREAGNGGHSLGIFMLRNPSPVLRPVAFMGEPGGTQWAHFNGYGLMATGQHLHLWSFR